MTVAELIEKLKALPQDLPVVTPGFDESGFVEVADPEVLEVRHLAGPRSTAEAFGTMERPDTRYRGIQFEGDPFPVVLVNF